MDLRRNHMLASANNDHRQLRLPPDDTVTPAAPANLSRPRPSDPDSGPHSSPTLPPFSSFPFPCPFPFPLPFPSPRSPPHRSAPTIPSSHSQPRGDAAAAAAAAAAASTHELGSSQMQTQTQMQARAQQQQQQQPPAPPAPSRSLPPPSYSQVASSAGRAHEHHHQQHQHQQHHHHHHHHLGSNSNIHNHSHPSSSNSSNPYDNGYGNKSHSRSSRHSPHLPPFAAATAQDADCTLTPLNNTVSNSSSGSNNTVNTITTINTIGGSSSSSSSNHNHGTGRHHLAHHPHDGGAATGGNGTTLPSLSSITADMPFHRLPPPRWSAYGNATATASANATANANASTVPTSTSFSTSSSTSYRPSPMFTPDSPAVTPMDMDGASRTGSASSPDRFYEGTPTPSSVTLDDPDVRLAAEALGDLRADFVSSPPSLPPMLPPAPPYGARSRQSSRPRSPKPEPLLSLLTTSHPLVASTIGGASSVYGGAKNYSPRFKSGAEYVEGYLTPLANTVNSVGRATGVEGGVRWFLGGSTRRRATGPTSDPAQEGSGAAKRRRTGPGGEAIDSPEMSAYDDSVAFALPRTPRRLSSASTLDSLPAYDDMRSPAYTEVAAPAPAHPSAKPRMKQHQRWPTRLITSTSGLSIAMSAESLRSLKYCLRWLRWANDHLNHVILMLKHALEEYEKAPEKAHSDDEGGGSGRADDRDDNGSSDGRGCMEVDPDSDGGSRRREREATAPRPSRTEIAARINSLKHDVLKTLQDVISNVSKYAGGALPENARDLVRRHLTSLPKRFLLATQTDAAGDKKTGGAGEPALEEGAQKMLVLAKEGLDIVAQVSGVLDGTIVSAEQWCDSLGRKRQSDDDDGDDGDKGFDGRERQDVKMD